MSIDTIISTVISSVISLSLSMFVFYYFRKYLDDKIAEREAKNKEREKRDIKRAIAESKRRQAAGRLFFWLYKGITKPPPNGELDEAMQNYNAVEDEQKTLERETIAAFDAEKK